MAEVVWRDTATDDLDRIIAYIRDHDPAAAARKEARLREVGESLAFSPDRGRPAGRFRELVVVRPYILRYSVSGDFVLIHSIRHGRRRPLKS